EAYLTKLPNLGEGQGRDDVAYNFACFLVRDLCLDDVKALRWLRGWDRGNTPPKGDERLAEIIASAHAYGQRAYGSGLGGLGGNGHSAGSGGKSEGGSPPPSVTPTPQATGSTRPTILITTEEYHVTDQAISALATDPDVYQRGCKLVRVLRDEGRKA